MDWQTSYCGSPAWQTSYMATQTSFQQPDPRPEKRPTTYKAPESAVFTTPRIAKCGLPECSKPRVKGEMYCAQHSANLAFWVEGASV
jgi:hypothetical protein